MAGDLRHAWQVCGPWLLAALLLFPQPLTGWAAETKASSEAPANPVQLFGTVEFRGTMRALPKWINIIELAREQTEKLARCDNEQASCSAVARSWQQMLAHAKTLESREQLGWVNSFFNRWPYRLDMEIYGVSDYWATPEEFMRYSGDCEDYSITKYFALRQLGYAQERLRIVVLQDSIRNIGHAVLAVYLDNDAYILDNMSNLLLSHSVYQHYSPYYSINEKYRWAHGRLSHPTSTSQQQ